MESIFICLIICSTVILVKVLNRICPHNDLEVIETEYTSYGQFKYKIVTYKCVKCGKLIIKKTEIN